MSSPDGDIGTTNSRVKIAILDSGISPEYLEDHRDPEVVYKDFITHPVNDVVDDPQHGTNSFHLIHRMIDTAQIYVAKVFQNREAHTKTASYMAEVVILLPPFFSSHLANNPQ